MDIAAEVELPPALMARSWQRPIRAGNSSCAREGVRGCDQPALRPGAETPVRDGRDVDDDVRDDAEPVRRRAEDAL